MDVAIDDSCLAFDAQGNPADIRYAGQLDAPAGVAGGGNPRTTNIELPGTQQATGSFWSFLTEAKGADELGSALALMIATVFSMILGAIVASALKLGGPASLASGAATLLIAGSMAGFPVAIWIVVPVCILTYHAISRGVWVR
ncbi:MAG: hypothetical protein F4X54_07480 [Chloroflexi bacterium]|nr:hypothetical protein [Chloroflexota bacterium]